MEMKAIADNYGYGEAAKMALQAGADILLYRSLEITKEAYEFVEAQIKEQGIHKNELVDKIERVIDCKKRFFKEYKPVYIPSLSKEFKENRHKALLDKIAQDTK